jgi:hypothetical protein
MTKTVTRYVIEINVGEGNGDDGTAWKKVGHLYASRTCARSWVGFAKASWHAREARVTALKFPKPPHWRRREIEMAFDLGGEG